MCLAISCRDRSSVFREIYDVDLRHKYRRYALARTRRVIKAISCFWSVDQVQIDVMRRSLCVRELRGRIGPSNEMGSAAVQNPFGTGPSRKGHVASDKILLEILPSNFSQSFA